MGGHVLVECMSPGWHILQYVVGIYYIGHFLQFKMSYWSTCLQEDISFRIICLTGGHLLYEEWFYWRVCLIGSHVDMRAYLTGGHVLHEYM